ncbi:MAG: DUF1573 domain-containing protein [Paludibacteraceae bacterium]|nr:DUF1573 domain-containing protein [Paludibacteraceae bacterium]
MKKILSTLCMTLAAVVMFAQDPVITFTEKEHNFGTIQEADGKVTTVFTFKNEGMAPLLITDAKASCGCTKPKYTEAPVEPGQTGTLSVTFNPSGYGGRTFTKTITVTSNASTPTVTLRIFGNVLAKQAVPKNPYVLHVGELSMSTRVLDLGTIQKGEAKGGELEYANLSAAAHQVNLATSPADAFLVHEISLPNPQPKEVGKFIFVIDSKVTKLYGPVEAKAYVVVDGKKDLSEDYALTIKATITEDFSQLSIEDKQNAPIIEVAKEVNLGTVASGKILRGRVEVLNVGSNPLEIRRVLSVDPALTVKGAKSIKSGKKGVITVDVNTKGLQPGVYNREITIISNDYLRSVKRVTVHFTVE